MVFNNYKQTGKAVLILFVQVITCVDVVLSTKEFLPYTALVVFIINTGIMSTIDAKSWLPVETFFAMLFKRGHSLHKGL